MHSVPMSNANGPLRGGSGGEEACKHRDSSSFITIAPRDLQCSQTQSNPERAGHFCTKGFLYTFILFQRSSPATLQEVKGVVGGLAGGCLRPWTRSGGSEIFLAQAYFLKPPRPYTYEDCSTPAHHIAPFCPFPLFSPVSPRLPPFFPAPPRFSLLFPAIGNQTPIGYANLGRLKGANWVKRVLQSKQQYFCACMSGFLWYDPVNRHHITYNTSNVLILFW